MSRSTLVSGGQSLVGSSWPRPQHALARADPRDLCRSRPAGRQGNLSAPVEMVYPIEDIKEAWPTLSAASAAAKILVAPNGPV